MMDLTSRLHKDKSKTKNGKVSRLDVLIPFFFQSSFGEGQMGFYVFLMGVLHSAQICYLLNLAGTNREAS